MPSSDEAARLESALEAFIAYQCAEPAPDRDAFLAEHEALRDLLEPMFADDAHAGDAAAATKPPVRRVGDFDILSELGRGGMGVVYEARQRSVDRRVALKVLASRLTTEPQAIARFHREASLAGRLHHPGIVEVFTVGSEDGEHFYAMELVDGVPLDAIVKEVRAWTADDLQRLSGIDATVLRALVADRLPEGTASGSASGSSRGTSIYRADYVHSMVAIAWSIAEALCHAHNQGVLHRDVKPSNIMIRRDGRAVLADFGLAREEGLPSMTLSGEFLGTPYYVSPEQAAGDRDRVGARSDVFSLGAVLYELVTLSPPFPGKTSAEVLHAVVNDEPQDPRRLHRELPADLAAVILRCLEKNPANRYIDAGELAADLQAVLENRPVQARHVSAGTRIFRWSQRNRALASTAAVALLLLSIGSTIAAFVLSNQNEEIRTANKQATENAATARREATAAKRITAFLVQLFEVADRSRHRGETITAREILDQGARRIALGLEDEPEVRATLMTTMGVVYQHLGLFEQARKLFDDALEIRRGGAASKAQLADSYFHLGEVRHYQSDFAEAERLYREALTFLRQVHTGDHLLVARTIDLLGRARRDQSAWADAKKLHDEAMAMRRRLAGERSVDLSESHQSLGLWHAYQGQLPAAKDHFEKALTMHRETAGPESHEIPAMLHGLAYVHFYLSDSDTARRYAKESITLAKKLFGDVHVSMARCHSLLGTIEATAMNTDVAERHYVEALRLARICDGEEHREVATLLHNLGTVAVDRNDAKTALKHCKAALAMRRKVLGNDHEDVAISLSYVGTVSMRLEQYKDAARYLEEAYTLRAKQVGNAHADTQKILQRLIETLDKLGANDAAKWRAKLTKRPGK